MRLQVPLGVVTPTLDGEVLGVLAGAEAAFTVGDLQRFVPHRSVEGIRKVLVRLLGEGIVVSEVSGRTHSYLLNRQHLAAEAVIALANLRATLMERIRGSIQGWNEQPIFGAVFGSAARGDMVDGSDIDIFLVHRDRADLDLFQQQADGLAHSVTAWTGNDARVLTYAEDEVRGAGDSDPVLQSVAREGKTVSGELVEFLRTLHSGARV